MVSLFSRFTRLCSQVRSGLVTLFSLAFLVDSLLVGSPWWLCHCFSLYLLVGSLLVGSASPCCFHSCWLYCFLLALTLEILCVLLLAISWVTITIIVVYPLALCIYVYLSIYIYIDVYVGACIVGYPSVQYSSLANSCIMFVFFLVALFFWLVIYLLAMCIYLLEVLLALALSLSVISLLFRIIIAGYCWLSSLGNFSAGWISHCWLFVFIIVVSFLVECLSDVWYPYCGSLIFLYISVWALSWQCCLSLLAPSLVAYSLSLYHSLLGPQPTHQFFALDQQGQPCWLNLPPSSLQPFTEMLKSTLTRLPQDRHCIGSACRHIWKLPISVCRICVWKTSFFNMYDDILLGTEILEHLL